MAEQQGFQRDITQQVDVPELQIPDFSDNTSGLDSLADIASVGLQVYNKPLIE